MSSIILTVQAHAQATILLELLEQTQVALLGITSYKTMIFLLVQLDLLVPVHLVQEQLIL